MTGVVVRGRGCDRDAVAHRTDGTGDRGGLLDIEALGDEAVSEPEFFGRAHLGDQVAGGRRRAGERVEAEFLEVRHRGSLPTITRCPSILSHPPTRSTRRWPSWPRC